MYKRYVCPLTSTCFSRENLSCKRSSKLELRRFQGKLFIFFYVYDYQVTVNKREEKITRKLKQVVRITVWREGKGEKEKGKEQKEKEEEKERGGRGLSRAVGEA